LVTVWRRFAQAGAVHKPSQASRVGDRDGQSSRRAEPHGRGHQARHAALEPDEAEARHGLEGVADDHH
jgi:hypothetical protein